MKFPVSILAAADGSDEEDEIMIIHGRHCDIPVLRSGLVKAIHTKDLCFLGHRSQDRK